MTITSGFFNSENHDRLYDAEQVSSIFDGIILDGVYQGVGDAFQVVPNEETNDSVIVKTGRAWFDHTWILNDSDFSIVLDPPNSALSRIDAIVLDIDRRKEVRKNSIIYVSGNYSTAPVYPTLTKSDLHNQYPLCYITVPAGSSTIISASNIENKVGSSDCPIVTGVLEVMKSDIFVQQMNSKFNEWFSGIKDLLDSNTALKLQNQIDNLQSSQNSQDIKINRLNAKVFSFSDGRDLGSFVSSEQHEKISNGDFSDFIAGDYWTIGGVKYYIVGFDSFYNLGDSDGSNKISEHHILLSPGEYIQTDAVDETFKVANYYSPDGDEMPWGLLYKFSRDKLENFTKAYSIPASKYIKVSSNSENKILSAFGKENVLSVPQPIPTDSQNFEVVWSKVIVPYDFQIGIKNYTSGYYSIASGGDKVQWVISNDSDFHLISSSLAIPTGLSTDDVNQYLGLSMVYDGDFESSVGVVSGASVKYYPSYLANPLFMPYYKNLIDDLASNFYNTIITGFNSTTSIRSSHFSDFGLGNFYAHGNYETMSSQGHTYSTHPGSSPWIFALNDECYDVLAPIFGGSNDDSAYSNIGGLRKANATGHILNTNFPSKSAMTGTTTATIDSRPTTFPSMKDSNSDFLYMSPEKIMAGGYSYLASNTYLGKDSVGTDSADFSDDATNYLDSYNDSTYIDTMKLYYDGGGFTISKEDSNNTTLREKGSWIFNASDYSAIYDVLCTEFKQISNAFDHIRIERGITNAVGLFAIK